MQHTGAGRVDAHMAQRQVRARRDRRRHQKEGRRRDVGRHVDLRAMQNLSAPHRGRRTITPHLHAKGRQHPLGVIAGGRRLGDAGLAFGIQPGQQHGRLELGAGHLELQVHGLQARHRPHLQRRPAILAADVGAHQRQRIDHPPHRPARQAGIPHQRAAKALSGQQAAQQPHRRARIAAVQHAGRRLQAVQPHAMHHHPALRGSVDAHAHRPEDDCRGQCIGPFQKAIDDRLSAGQRPQHDRAVRDRLVARHADVPTHLAGRRHLVSLKHELIPPG